MKDRDGARTFSNRKVFLIGWNNKDVSIEAVVIGNKDEEVGL